ncbi:MAG: hypothetical protein JO103_11665 [Candidatus Eremiobacteraeota bacterium]|nr:hypothetical protein [Candidatus Eremiobacteraeota bacterium]
MDADKAMTSAIPMMPRMDRLKACAIRVSTRFPYFKVKRYGDEAGWKPALAAKLNLL